MAYLVEASYSRAEIQSVQLEKLRETWAGKKATKSDCQILSKARIITGADVIRLKKEREDWEAVTILPGGGYLCNR